MFTPFERENLEKICLSPEVDRVKSQKQEPQFHICHNSGLKAHKDGKSYSVETGKLEKHKLEQWELLATYQNLISSQIKNNCFDGAMKTFKKIKLFKLDCMNPNDVHECVGKKNLWIKNSSQGGNHLPPPRH